MTYKSPNTRPAKLIDQEEQGSSFRACGYPQRYEGEDQFRAYGKIHDRLNTGTLQVQHDRNKGIFVQEGFNGGPVWDEIREGVVSMVVAAAPRDG